MYIATRKKTILIVEDDVTLQKALTEKFTSREFFVFNAQDGEEGLKVALEKHPNLITIDILMPKKDGIKLMDEIRKDTWGKTVPIIILTNLDADDKMIVRINEDQPAYYCIKANIKIEDLIAKAEELVNTNNTL